MREQLESILYSSYKIVNKISNIIKGAKMEKRNEKY